MKKNLFAALVVFLSVSVGANALLPPTTGTNIILKQGDTAPGIANAKFVTIGIPATNNFDQVAFQGTVTGINSAATRAIGTGNSGIWAVTGSGGPLKLIAQAGWPAAGLGEGTVFPALFSSFSDPVYNNNYAVAFIATLRVQYPTVTPSTSSGIWSNEGAGAPLHCIARTGYVAPGATGMTGTTGTATAVAYSSFDQVAISDQGGNQGLGGVVFLAHLAGPGITAYNKEAIFEVDTYTTSPYEQNPRLVLQQGQSWFGKTIASLSILGPTTNTAGQTRSFSQPNGDIQIQCTYTDGTWGILSMASGLEAYYQFLGNTNDSSGLNNTGTGANITYYTGRGGEANSALSLDGSDSYVQYPDRVISYQAVGFTWSMWVWPSAITVSDSLPGIVINHGDYNGEADLYWTGSNAAYTFEVNLGKSGSNRYTVDTTSIGPIDTESWHQITCVYQYGQQISIYVDGTQVDFLAIPAEQLYFLYGIGPNSAIGALLPNTTGSAVATGTATLSGGSIAAINVINPGQGYISPPTVTVTDATGTDATAIATVSNGAVTGITVTNGGNNYSNPAVTISAWPTLVSSTTTNYFDGLIDDVKIFDYAFTPNEVAALYTLDSQSLTNTIVDRWNYAVGSGGGEFVTTGVPATNTGLGTAFQANIGAGSSTGGIWAGYGTWEDLQLIALYGMNAPGATGAAFSTFSDPVFNNYSNVAFIANLKIAPGNKPPVPTGTGIWSTDGGVLQLVAQVGQQAPGLAAGVKFTSFSQYVLPDKGGADNLGGVVFLARAGATQGIWAVDTTGTLQLVLRLGSVVNGKTVTGMTFLSQPKAEAGQTRSFSQSTGDLLVKCTFSDGTWGLVQVVFP